MGQEPLVRVLLAQVPRLLPSLPSTVVSTLILILSLPWLSESLLKKRKLARVMTSHPKKEPEIPNLQREEKLRRTLQSLKSQQTPKWRAKASLPTITRNMTKNTIFNKLSSYPRWRVKGILFRLLTLGLTKSLRSLKRI